LKWRTDGDESISQESDQPDSGGRLRLQSPRAADFRRKLARGRRKVLGTVLNSVREYLDRAIDENIKVEVQLSYLNTGSFKAMVQLCRSLDEAAKKGNAVAFSWRYRQDDEMARGYGEDLEASVQATALQITFKEEAS
jgi:SiaC family regulatory phosphoprotein